MSDTERWLAEARDHRAQARFTEAEEVYRRILTVEPDHAEALHQFGVLRFRAGDQPAAEASLRRVIALSPKHIAAHVNLGRMLRSSGKLDEAIVVFRAALAIDRFVVPALIGLGDALLAIGKAGEAIEPARRAVGLEPDDAEAQNVLGAALQAVGQPAAALECLDRAVARAPANGTAHYNRGVTLQALGRTTDALAAYRRAVAEAPDLSEAHNNLGMLLNEIGDYRAALEQLRNAAERVPMNSTLHNNLGTTFVHLGELDRALVLFNRAIELDPGYAEPHANAAGVQRLLGRLGPALQSCDRALGLNPDLADAHYNRAVILRQLGRFDEALAGIDRALELRPRSADFRALLGLLCNDRGRHRDAVAHCQAAVALDPTHPRVHHALLGLLPYSLSLDPAERFAEHTQFGRRFAQRQVSGGGERSRDPGRKLRIGYVSSDLRADHPIARNFAPMLASRDRNRFEVYTYPELAVADATSEEFRRLSDGWRPTLGLTDEEVAAVVAADRIDILVVLAGRFDRNRPLVAAYRPAPICVSFHDPATSGIDAFDYLIADPVLVPRHTTERFVERVLRLGSFYTHTELVGAPAVGSLPRERAEAATFGCFNNPAKLSDECLALWAGVLRAVPHARLLLKFHSWYESHSLSRRVVGALHAEGIDLDRIQIAHGERAGLNRLEIYNQIDIALDSYPFTGSTTTFESLWMGVPVVTLAGPTMVSRWSASMLRSIGLPELIADTPAAYVDTAAALANDVGRLRTIRAGLRQRIIASPICDSSRRARQLERLYRAMWRRWCAAQGGSAQSS
jgi:protein O-GlcNAc transferase